MNPEPCGSPFRRSSPNQPYSFFETRNLSVAYNSDLALSDLTVSVSMESVCALVGPNGAGKSTLIATLMNARRPTRGSASLMGIDSRLLRPRHFRSIGYVSADQRLPSWMTVDEFLRFLAPLYPTWDKSVENQLLSLMELPRRRQIRALSRGMAAKFAICSSLAYRPAVLILDEPFSGLDSIIRDELRELLLTITRPKAVLIATHDIEDIEGLATDILYLDHGSLLLKESIHHLSERFRLIAADALPLTNAPLPTSWVRSVERSGKPCLIEREYSPEDFRAKCDRVFGPSATVAAQKLPLRSIIRLLPRRTQ